MFTAQQMIHYQACGCAQLICDCACFVIPVREPCRQLQSGIMYKCLESRTSKISFLHLHYSHRISAHPTKLLAICQLLQIFRTRTCLSIPQSKNCSSATSNPSSLPFLFRSLANSFTKAIHSHCFTLSSSLRDLSKRTDSTAHRHPFGLPNHPQIKKAC